MNRIPDPFGSLQGLLNGFSGFMQNPLQLMMQRGLNIPQNMMNNPGAIIQHMMNNGMLNQQQYNFARDAANRTQKTPAFQQFMNRR